MTVLQKIIERLEKEIRESQIQERRAGLRQCIKYVESYLPAEEQQIRDTWEAAKNYYEGGGSGNIIFTDFETYLTALQSTKP